MFNPRFGRRRALALCAALLGCAASPALLAQDFPSKPLKFIVPFGRVAAPIRRHATTPKSCRC